MKKAELGAQESGISWIGRVPAHWTVKCLKHIALFQTGWTPPTGDAASYVGTNLWANIGDLEERVITRTKNCISDGAVAKTGIPLTPKGSLLFSFKLSVGQVSIAAQPMYTNEAIASFLPQDGFHTPWAFYAFPEFIVRNAEINIYGAKLLNRQRINDAVLPVPPVAEQVAIASYLDVETARIDALIAEKKGLLNALEQLKTTRISQVLTGAELPSVESHDEWLPTIPRGWRLVRLKFLGQVRSGIAKGKKYEGTPMVEVPYLRVANVQDGYLDLSTVSLIEVSGDEAERYALKPGDVLMNEGGDYDKVGRGAMWSGEVSPCIHQNHVFAVRLEDVSIAPWLAAITRTAYAKFYFMNNAKQSTNLASISQGNVKEFPVVLPPEAERGPLLQRLNEELLRFSDLSEHAREEMNLLAELRSTTITDAVLGRIDVRPIVQNKKELEAA